MNVAAHLHHRHRSVRSQGGVVILEALVAMAIFTVGVLGLIGLQARAVKNTQDLQSIGVAATLANQLISSIYAMDGSSIDTANPNANAVVANWRNQVSGALPNGVGVVDLSQSSTDSVPVPGGGNNPAKRLVIKVKISWNLPGGVTRSYQTVGSANNW